MKKLLLLCSILFLGACASGSTRTDLLTPEMSDFSQSTLSLEIISTGEANVRMVSQLRDTLLLDLNRRSGFRGAVYNLEDSDYVLSVKIIDSNSVGETKRVMLGSLAGRAKMLIQATLYERGQNEPIGITEVEGKSSGGTIFAGTNDDSLQLVSNEIMKWLTGRP